jgi:excisionase family DNA binding protein
MSGDAIHAAHGNPEGNAPASRTRMNASARGTPTEGLPDDVRLLTVREACEALSCGPRTLWTWTASGLLKPVRVGRRFIRYPLSEVRRFIRQHASARPES